jgi:hypothetical protein
VCLVSLDVIREHVNVPARPVGSRRAGLPTPVLRFGGHNAHTVRQSPPSRTRFHSSTESKVTSSTDLCLAHLSSCNVASRAAGGWSESLPRVPPWRGTSHSQFVGLDLSAFDLLCVFPQKKMSGQHCAALGSFCRCETWCGHSKSTRAL